MRGPRSHGEGGASRPLPLKSLTAGLVIAAALIVLAVGLTGYRHRAALLRADPEQILGDARLRKAALSEGASVFARNCASCHGRDAKGDPTLGVPDLTDDERLYAATTVAEIEAIARYGIRSGNPRGWSLAVMPAFASAEPAKGEPLPSLSPREIEDLTQFLLDFSGRSTSAEAAARGRDSFQNTAGCWDCHGRGAEGDPAIGGPALSDGVWLYGGDHDAIYRSIAHGRAGASPAFARRLTPIQLRSVAAYVASLAPPSAKDDPR